MNDKSENSVMMLDLNLDVQSFSFNSSEESSEKRDLVTFHDSCSYCTPVTEGPSCGPIIA